MENAKTDAENGYDISTEPELEGAVKSSSFRVHAVLGSNRLITTA